MAICPKCKGEMVPFEAICPHCGFDFPEPPRPPRRRLTYSTLANVALILGQIVAGLACLYCACFLYVGIEGYLSWPPRDCDAALAYLVTGLYGFFVNLALMVVFGRVRKL